MPPEYDNELEYFYDPDEFHREVVYVGVSSPEAFSRQQARDADRRAIETFGIPSILLMENAAIAVVREIKEYAVFAVVCAPGSNGGDGLAIARHLCIMGKDVRVYILGDPKKGSEDFRTNLKIMSRLAPEVLNTVNDENFEEFESALKGCEACVDAIFGTGLNRPVEGIFKRAIEAMNSLSSHVVAVDIPSGLDCDTGEELGAAVRAARTITFHRMKKGLDISPQFGGDVTVSYIGIPN
ncbi:MAG: NAD(P)H-hydrate epimerase [Synergistaceae bacterium]|nr:NAD(P)H-hydrate epimerase [Synergistaceae bacterium]MBR1657675.1 NAD(P)H-hydrate epimerase [Synergistaceae bacterium]